MSNYFCKGYWNMQKYTFDDYTGKKLKMRKKKELRGVPPIKDMDKVTNS